METENLDLGRPRRTSAKLLARRLIKGAKIIDAPVSLQMIIEFLQSERDLIIRKQNLSKKISGLVVVCRDAEGEYATIVFNENHPWCRRRLTLAHEIGHLMFGHSCGDGDAYNEREAYIFAAELLIPQSFLKKDVKNGLSIPSLSLRYRVSQEALTIKLMDDRLLSSMLRR